MSKNILFLVEGESKEKQIINKITKEIPFLNQYNIVSYNTNIYVLYKKILDYYQDEDMEYIKDMMDTTGLLIDIEQHKKDKREDLIELLKQSFSEIYLIFDLDCHDSQFSKEIITSLSNIFDNEVDRGKLYLNYPMIEGLYHFDIKDNQDVSFLTRTYHKPQENIPKNRYKRLVGLETKTSRMHHIAIHQINSWNHDFVIELLYLHLLKIHHIISQNQIFNLDELDYQTTHHLLRKQIEHMKNDDYIYVVSCLPLLILDRGKEHIIRLLEEYQRLENKLVINKN